jgi:TRAP-type C4-dicarboxylate transport system permease small subunit
MSAAIPGGSQQQESRMAILDALLAIFDGCFGSLEVLTFLFDIAAVYVGVSTMQKRNRAKQHALKKPSWTPFVALLIFAIFFTALTVYKYTKQ